ncbi:phosphopantetheine-binding protein [Streptomyces yangpuensis]|uniref:phosphopantetheine-binding protein n=1 Tax=Streptomyces yangpuensis TaxID=1648182 RepID=UPI0027E23F82|nr:phosphopantetheine-binding protein [Streptomyces yangpuensis]
MTNEHPAAVLTDLIEVLGDILRVEPAKIDPDQTFPALGLDSLLVVEFVAVVRRRYGVQVRAADLYDYPTPTSFAQEITRSRSRPASAPAAAPVPTPAPAGVAQGPSPAARIAEVLRQQLAAILCCDPGDINTTAPFNLLGVDSIVGAEFIAAVNQTFGLRERAVMLYEHPNLVAMAAYIAIRTGEPAPAPASAPALALAQASAPAASRTAARPAPAARPLPGRDLDVLLDAIRDDRLTVDEALVLLGRRG